MDFTGHGTGETIALLNQTKFDSGDRINNDPATGFVIRDIGVLSRHDNGFMASREISIPTPETDMLIASVHFLTKL